MMLCHAQSCWRIALLAAALTLAADARGQEEENAVHWAFGSFLGTGWYKVSKDREVFVLRIPPKWTWRKSSFENGNRRYGVEFRFPVTLGLNQIEDVGGILDQENFSTASLTPKVEMEIPVNTDWYLRPYLSVGWGAEFDGGERAWIYEGGVKSRYALPFERGDWGLLASIDYAGYSPNRGDSSDLLNLMGGLETRHRAGNLALRDRPLFLEWHLTYNRLSDPATFRRRNNPDVEITDFFELGLAFSQGREPFTIFGINFDRFGLAYQLSSDGRYRAIKINLNSPFKR